MAYLNTESILNDALTLISNDDIRTEALVWLNETIRDLHMQRRAWKFLEDTVTLTITSDTATLPAGASEIVYLKTDSFLFTPADQLTDSEVYEIENDESEATGYTLGADGTITFYPSTDETSCELKYETNYTAALIDSPIDTIYPIELSNLFISGVRLKAYMKEKDGRLSAEAAIYQYEMSSVKAWDNSKKASSKLSAKGYTRVQ